MRRPRRGFSLIEVMVALTISGLAISIVAGLLAATVDAVDVTVRSADEHGEDALLRAWLNGVLRSASVDVDPARSFYGDATSMRVHARSLSPRGWPEDGVVDVDVEGGRLFVSIGSHRMPVLDSLDHAVFDYRIRSNQGDDWLVRWESYTELPLAVRLRYTRDGVHDTLVVITNPRPS
ncbi:MAG: prepilin-type N-terminal cleavage/methylation domain-containing protein [Gemmatimonadota bacterium]